MKEKNQDVREQPMVVSNEQRKNRRMDYLSQIYCVKYIADGKEVEPETPIELRLLNISEGGLGVISPIVFAKDSLLVLNITLEEERYERVSARVIWETQKGDQHRHGLLISNMSGKLFTHINKLDNSIKTEV